MKTQKKKKNDMENIYTTLSILWNGDVQILQSSNAY